MICKHEHTQELSTRGFTGPVSIENENRAAHGCITVEVECTQCGARRRENLNQCHAEYGDWGPSREERRQAAERLRRELPAIPEPATFTSTSGRKVTVLCDEDGYLRVSGSLTVDERDFLAASYPGLEQAVVRKESWAAYQEALSNV